MVTARAVRGKKGDVVLRLPNGKIAFPLDFKPVEGEWYDVDVVEERERFARVVLHRHVPRLETREPGAGEYWRVEVVCERCGRRLYGWYPGLDEWYERQYVPEEVRRFVEAELVRRFGVSLRDVARRNLELKRRIEEVRRAREEMRERVSEFLSNLKRHRDEPIEVYESERYWYIVRGIVKEPRRYCANRVCAKRCVCYRWEEEPGEAEVERIDKRTLRSEVIRLPVREVRWKEEEGFGEEPYRRLEIVWPEPVEWRLLNKYDEDLKPVSDLAWSAYEEWARNIEKSS